MKTDTKKYVVIFLLLASFSYHVVIECAKSGEAKVLSEDELKEMSKPTEKPARTASQEAQIDQAYARVYDDKGVRQSFEGFQGKRDASLATLKRDMKKVIPVLFSNKKTSEIKDIMQKIGALDPSSTDYYDDEVAVFELLISKIAAFLLAFYEVGDSDIEKRTLKRTQLKDVLIPLMVDRLQRRKESLVEIQTIMPASVMFTYLVDAGFVILELSDGEMISDVQRAKQLWFSSSEQGRNICKGQCDELVLPARLVEINKLNALLVTAQQYIAADERD
jgi:hypothetical protein